MAAGILLNQDPVLLLPVPQISTTGKRQRRRQLPYKSPCPTVFIHRAWQPSVFPVPVHTSAHLQPVVRSARCPATIQINRRRTGRAPGHPVRWRRPWTPDRQARWDGGRPVTMKIPSMCK